jgi:hypothetical protein
MATGALISLLIVLVAVFAPLIVPYPADAGSAAHPEMALEAPSMQHLFGTDQVGRDVFSRVLEGTRVSPVVAVFVLLIACLVGIPLGVVAGFPPHPSAGAERPGGGAGGRTFRPARDQLRRGRAAGPDVRLDRVAAGLGRRDAGGTGR